MAIEFRCEKCGKLLSLDTEPGGTVNCPHCRSDIVVPAALASLPHPQVPPDAVATGTSQPPPLPGGQQAPSDASGIPPEELPDEQEHSDAVLSAMAHIMPWVISLFLHAGLALIFLFAVMFSIGDEANLGAATGAHKAEEFEDIDPYADPFQKSLFRDRRVFSRAMSGNEAVSDSGTTEKQVRVIGAGSSGGTGDFKLKGGGGKFFGIPTGRPGNPAYHFVFVIDRSGSMIGTFDFVRMEMRRSISRLRHVQDFHVIFFAGGEPIELRSRRLVPATDANKMALWEFLEGVRAGGQTDPVPAMERAFAVLAKANKKPGRVIFLLTDGVFPDNKKVLATISVRNKAKKVHIYTFLYGERPPEAVEVMKKIASENGGKYKFVKDE